MDTVSSYSLHTDKECGCNSIWKGLYLTSSIASIGFILSTLPFLNFLSPMMIAVLLGAVFKSIFDIPSTFQKGITFSTQKLLKVAIIALGLQLSVTQLLAIGWNGLLTIFLILGSTFMFCLFIGKWLKLDSRLVRLIAAGTSICGASAIMATNSVIKGKDEHVAYAISIVSLFGFLSMLLFPVAGNFLQLDSTTFGFWSGASIHDTAQVIGTSSQGGQESSEVGIVTKLSRVLFLIPVILILGYTSGKKAIHSKNLKKNPSYIPWFVLGFITLVVLNSFIIIDPSIKEPIGVGNKFLLTVALAAMGLQINFSKIKATGIRPLALGAMAWVYISVVGLIMIRTLN